MTQMTIAKGSQLTVTDPQHRALKAAKISGSNRIGRGRLEDGAAPITTLKALAKRQFVTLVCKSGTGIVLWGVVTGLGWKRLAELDEAAEREALRHKMIHD